MVIQDFDGRTLRRHFVDPTDALEFRVLITRRIQRYRAGLELIPEQVTFGEWAQRWIEGRKKTRPASTWRGELSKLNSVWLPLFRDVPLQMIHSTSISEALQGIIDSGRSPATRNRHRALLLKIFNDARFSQPSLLTINPVSLIKALPERWKKRRHVGFRSVDEMQRYCESARQFGLGWWIIATILVWSGIRIGEALALRWMDMQGEVIRVRRLRCSTTNLIHERTKGQKDGGEYRALLLPPVREALEFVRRARENVKSTDLLCGNPEISYWRANKFHRYTRHRAENLDRFSLHRIRHSFSRMLIRIGFSRDEVQDVIGHESPETTERYTRMPDISRQIAKAKRKKIGT